MTEVLEYEGLREVAQALAVIDRELLHELEQGLEHTGEVLREDATRRFVAYHPSGNPGPRSSFERSAESFEVRVRAGGAATALVVVGQRRRSSRQQTMRRPNWGGLQVKHALLPARTATLEASAEILEREVHGLMRRHGF